MINILLEDLKKMEIDQYHQITIYDLKYNRILHKNIDHNFILDNYGTSEAFIQDLKDNGIKSIKVYRKRANGSTSKSIADPYEVIFEPTAPAPVQTSISFENTPPVQAPIPAYEPMQTNNNMNNNYTGIGLSGADVTYRAIDYPKIEQKLRETELENKELKKENEQLSRKNFELELEIKLDDKKSQRNTELIGMLAPAFAPVLEKVMASKTGLSEPAPQLPKFDNQINLILDQVGNLLTKSEDFYIELDDLMKKYLQK